MNVYSIFVWIKSCVNATFPFFSFQQWIWSSNKCFCFYYKENVYKTFKTTSADCIIDAVRAQGTETNQTNYRSNLFMVCQFSSTQTGKLLCMTNITEEFRDFREIIHSPQMKNVCDLASKTTSYIYHIRLFLVPIKIKKYNHLTWITSPSTLNYLPIKISTT